MSKDYKFNTYEEAMEAVKDRGWKLEYVRPDLQTTKMAMMAVKGGALDSQIRSTRSTNPRDGFRGG